MGDAISVHVWLLRVPRVRLSYRRRPELFVENSVAKDKKTVPTSHIGGTIPPLSYCGADVKAVDPSDMHVEMRAGSVVFAFAFLLAA